VVCRYVDARIQGVGFLQFRHLGIIRNGVEARFLSLTKYLASTLKLLGFGGLGSGFRFHTIRLNSNEVYA